MTAIFGPHAAPTGSFASILAKMLRRGDSFEKRNFDPAVFTKPNIFGRRDELTEAAAEQWFKDRTWRGAFGPQEVLDDVGVGVEAPGIRFMMGKFFFEEDEEEDKEWGPVRLLGKGGWGCVGLWQKRDDQNQVIDELALKEQKFKETRTPEHLEVDPRKFPRLLKEAVIQRDLNKKGTNAILRLRGYKYIDWGTRQLEELRRPIKEGRYRMYLAYAPHGDLEHLKELYRAWDHYLPELFVWHVFHRLAVASHALHDAPPADSLYYDSKEISLIQKLLERQKKTAGSDHKQRSLDLRFWFCLHLDLKPLNVLLDDELEDVTQGSEEDDMPAPKLSDFGIAEYTGWDDTRNPEEFWSQGTVGYKIPVGAARINSTL